MREPAGILITLSLAAVLSACATTSTGVVQQREHDFGTYQLYIPDTYTVESNVVVLVHGTPQLNEDVRVLARTFIDRWTDFADETGAVLVAPAFSQVDFASCDCGAYGGYRGLYGRLVGADEFLHAILDEANEPALAPTLERRFFLYGHSAGGQFANRYVVRHPDRLLGAVLSAPGRYAFPDTSAEWHYGTGGVVRTLDWSLAADETQIDITPDPEGWISAVSLPIAVVVGDQDLDPQPCRPAHCSPSQETATRIQIGVRWVSKMDSLALANGRQSGIRFELVPGVGHSSANLTPASQAILAGLLSPQTGGPGG